MPFTIRQVQTSDLLVTYLEDSASDGWPTILTHGFPYGQSFVDRPELALSRKRNCDDVIPARIVIMVVTIVAAAITVIYPPPRGRRWLCSCSLARTRNRLFMDGLRAARHR
jgi:hypothetical protein